MWYFCLQWYVLQVCFLSLTMGSSCSLLWNPTWTQQRHSRGRCLLAGTKAIIRFIFFFTSGKVGGDRIIRIPLWQVLPSCLALKRWRYIYSAFYYRLGSPPVFPFLILISASQTEADVCNELVETPDVAVSLTVSRKTKICCVLLA